MKGGVIKVAKEGGMPDGVKSAIGWTVGLASIALILVIVLILFGNLSGNTGFAEDSAGFNNTENVIGNYSESAVNTAAQFPVVGTIIGIAILLVVLIGILIFAITKMMKVANMGGGSYSSFG